MTWQHVNIATNSAWIVLEVVLILIISSIVVSKKHTPIPVSFFDQSVYHTKLLSLNT